MTAASREIRISLSSTLRAARARILALAMPRPPELGLPALILLSSLWLSSVVNVPFWRVVWEGTGGARADNVVFLVSLAACAVAWTFLLLSVVAWGRAARPVLATVLLVSAAASYFMHAYGVLIDRDMVTNVAQTDWAEARDLLTWRLGAWLLVLGALPALAMTRVRIARRTWKRELALKAVTMVAAAACFAGLVLVNYQHFASLARNHRELRYLLVPQNIASALHSHVKRAFAVPLVLEAVGTDASRAAPAVVTGKPLLMVVAIGETARAANFSLNGYARATNPELARRDVLSYTDVTACGTSTAVSLPCMFLDAGRAGFDDTLVRRRESLLDVLQRAGLAVRWLDNNSGCKGVCDRVPHEDLSRHPASVACPGGECLDEVLVERLRAGLDRLDRDTVVVLHLMGSHGPAYYKRYPAEFGVFAPACDTVQLDRCSQQSIINAYDNSLRYTDHILAATIDLLQANAGRYDTAMLYVSDHGESLGEKGLYLHGVPYALAPREQLQVPLVLWLSGGMRERLGVDVACLRSHRGEPISHDNLYHSVLGLSAVRAGVYRPERDLLHRCRA